MLLIAVTFIVFTIWIIGVSTTANIAIDGIKALRENAEISTEATAERFKKVEERIKLLEGTKK